MLNNTVKCTSFMTPKYTPKQREDMMYAGEKADRAPVAQINGIVSSQWNGHQWKEPREDPKLAAKLISTFNREAGCDVFITLNMETNAPFMDYGMKLKFVDNNYSNVMSCYYEDIEDVEKKPNIDMSSRKTAPNAWKYLVDFCAEAEKYERENYAPEDRHYTYGFNWGIMTCAGHLRGCENFMMDTMLEPELAHKTIANAAELVEGVLAACMSCGNENVWVADPTSSGTMVSGEIYADYVLKPWSKLVKKLHSDGAKVVYHVCGETVPVIEPISQSGIDMFSFDFASPIPDIHAVVGDKFVLAGNLNPMTVIWEGTPESVNARIKDIFENELDGARYCICTGCETPRDTPIQNLQAMKQASEMYSQ